MVNVLSSFKHMPRRGKVVSLLVFLFLLLAIVLTAYEVRQQQSYRSNAQGITPTPAPYVTCSGPTVLRWISGPGGWEIIGLSQVKVGDKVNFQFSGNHQELVTCEKSKITVNGQEYDMYWEGTPHGPVCQGPKLGTSYYPVPDGGITGVSAKLFHGNGIGLIECNTGAAPPSVPGTGLCHSGVEAYKGTTPIGLDELSRTTPGETIRYAVKVAQNVDKVIFSLDANQNSARNGNYWYVPNQDHRYYYEYTVKEGTNTINAKAIQNGTSLTEDCPSLTFTNTPSTLHLTTTCWVRYYDMNWQDLQIAWPGDGTPGPLSYTHLGEGTYSGKEVYVAVQGGTRYCGMYCGGATPLPSCKQHPETQCPVQDCEGWTCIGGNTACKNPLCPNAKGCVCPAEYEPGGQLSRPGQIPVEKHFASANFTITVGSNPSTKVSSTQGYDVPPGGIAAGYYIYYKYTLPGGTSASNPIKITAVMQPKSFGRDDPFTIINSPSCDNLPGFYVTSTGGGIPPSGGTPTLTPTPTPTPSRSPTPTSIQQQGGLPQGKIFDWNTMIQNFRSGSVNLNTLMQFLQSLTGK